MTARSEEAKAELKVAEQKLADAKAELADAKAELASAEAKQEQVEQKLMETKQADSANTAEVQRLEQKLHTLNGDIAVLRKAFYSKSASVESKEDVIRRHESQLPLITGPSLASSGGETMQSNTNNTSQRAPLTISLSLSSLSPLPWRRARSVWHSIIHAGDPPASRARLTLLCVP